MAGVIRTYQRPPCGGRFPPSKGETLITCSNGCSHHPSKYYIDVYWQKKNHRIYRTKRREPIDSWRQAIRTLESIRDQIDEKTFDLLLYKKENSNTFCGFWERYQEKKVKAKPSGRGLLRTITQRLEALGKYDIREIRGFHIEDFQQALVDEGLSPAYINRFMLYIQACFKYAVRVNALEKLPSFPESLEIPAKELQWLTREEQLNLFNSIPGHDRPIFMFLFLTNCRVSEAAALQRKDIDWDKGLVLIRHIINNDGELQTHTKGKAIRIIPLGAELRQLFLSLTPNLTGYIFLNKHGRRYYVKSLRRIWRRALAAAGVKHIQLKNASRHSWALIFWPGTI